ncbi:hypothetical protein FRC04_002117 [Tulasnella sp. 424]|nr:hypothetical protein FRC04_002117 [Tulasnella sp. 424]
MAGIPPPRMRVSRSGLYDSQADNYPSDFLHDSAQLQETSAPFMNQPSLEDSLWPSHAPQDTPSGDDSEEYAQYSSNSATPGPPTRTAGAASFPQMRGGNTNNNSNASPAAALKDLVKRLGNSSTPSRPPPPPAPRSEADSDILDSDTEKKQMHSIRTTFRQAAGQLGGPHDESDAIDLATPKQAHPGSRIPVSSGRPKQRRSSLERSTATGATGFRTSFSDDEAREEAEVSRIASSALDRSNSRSFGDEEALDEAEVSRIASSAVDRSGSKSFEALQARLDSSNLDDYLPSSDGGFSPPGSPRIENLNESTVDLTAGHDVSFPQAEAEISEKSQVDFSTPIKTKAERQLELERSWGRASSSGLYSRPRTVSQGSRHDHSRPDSPAHSLRRSESRDEVRASSPVGVWEKDRERNWNNPRPKPLGARPPSPPREKRTSLDGYISGSTRSRTSSISSMASVEFQSKGKEREHSLNSPPPAPSPAPSSPSSPHRVRTVSSPTPADILHERERSWNRPQRSSHPTTPSHTHSPHAHVHTRSPAVSMTGLDSAVKSLRSSTTTPPPALARSKSLGHSAGKTSPGEGAHRPTTPSTSFGRRISFIDAVKEETEPESSVASQPESELSTSHPQIPMPRSTTPPVPQSGSETSSIVSEEQKGSQSEHSEREKKPSLTSRFSLKRDASRLKKLFSSGSRSKSPAPQSTTPQSSPPRPGAEPESNRAEEPKPEPVSSTPQTSPAKSREAPPPTNIVTPTKRPFHEYPATLPTPSPPRGGLPALPDSSESEGEDEPQLSARKSVSKEASRIVPLFGAGRFLPKTPKFPGAWSTPGTVARAASPPPFDDREHPHPKGKAVEALKLKPEDAIPSDSDASTPVVRPMEVPPEPVNDTPQEESISQGSNDEAVEVPERVMTPTPESHAVTKAEPKTPYPPGGWGRTPSQRKSILKVRFDAPRQSPGHQTSSLPATPDEVKDKAFKLLEGLGGIMADEGYGSLGKTVQQPTTSTPSRGPNISMVDGLGRQLYAASDGAFIQRLDQRGRTMSTDSAQSSSSIGLNEEPPLTKPASSAIEVNVTEPRKRTQTHPSGQNVNPEDVSLNSPPPQGQQGYYESDGSSDDSPYPTKVRIKRIRHAIDDVRRSLDGSLSFGSEDEPTLEQRLELDLRLNQERERSLKAQSERRKLQRQLQSPADGQGPKAQPRPARTSRQPKTLGNSMSNMLSSLLTVKWTLFIFAQIIILWFMLEFAKRHAETLFYTTHYDPTWAGYHDSGDPHAPTTSQWLMLGRDAASAAAWFEDLLYHYFGIYGGRTTLRPNLVPT